MEPVLFSIEDNIARLTLNRPQKRNAMNEEMISLLLHHLREISEHEGVRVLILQGAGEHFCAGADIEWMQKTITQSHDQNFEDAQLIADLMLQLYCFTKPTIALAKGATMGGGLGLLAACDMAIASRDAFFAFSEVKIGIAPSNISPYVIHAIGERAARYYFLTAERFDAGKAKAMGLVHDVVESNELLDKGLEICGHIKQNSPQALTATKELIHSIAKEKIGDLLSQKTAEHLTNLRSTKEANEGLQAFLEKRKPNWSL